MSGYGANQYKQASVMTASKPQVLIMLYEAAIRNIKRAVICIEEKDLNGKGIAIGKTQDIINELLNTLDFKVGGKLAEDLEGLYNFISEQLLTANIDNSSEKLIVAQKLLETLLDGWKGAIQKLTKDEASTEEVKE